MNNQQQQQPTQEQRRILAFSAFLSPGDPAPKSNYRQLIDEAHTAYDLRKKQ